MLLPLRPEWQPILKLRGQRGRAGEEPHQGKILVLWPQGFVHTDDPKLNGGGDFFCKYEKTLPLFQGCKHPLAEGVEEVASWQRHCKQGLDFSLKDKLDDCKAPYGLNSQF